MTIIGLDLGTRTGWCVMYDTGKVVSGVCSFADKRHERGMKYTRFRAWLSELLTQQRPGLVAWEQPHMRGGAATEMLLAFQGHVEELCSSLGVPAYTSVHTSTLKSFATGGGRANKERMVAEARARWGVDLQEDEAEARWVAEWARREYGTGPQAAGQETPRRHSSTGRG